MYEVSDEISLELPHPGKCPQQAAHAQCGGPKGMWLLLLGELRVELHVASHNVYSVAGSSDTVPRIIYVPTS